MTEPSKSGGISGWLWMRKADVQRYQKMWFILTNDVLARYASPEDTADTCQGEINLAGAVIDVDDTCQFVICQDGQSYHVKADDQAEKLRWIEALLAARGDASEGEQVRDKTATAPEVESERGVRASQSMGCSSAKANCFMNDDPQNTIEATDSNYIERETPEIDHAIKKDDRNPQHKMSEIFVTNGNIVPAESINSGSSLAFTADKFMKNLHDTSRATTLISIMRKRLEDIQSCNAVLNQANLDLQQSIVEMKSCQGNDKNLCVLDHQCMLDKVAEYQAAASMMTSACKSYMNLANSYDRNCVVPYQPECEHRLKMEQVVRSLTQAQSKLSGSISEDDENIEYFDCCESDTTSGKSCPNVNVQVYQVAASTSGNHKRRTRVPDRPNVSDSLWSVLKNCIGSDLSKMPLPVSFAEPLSLLQRLTEDFEYANVLDKASECTDVATQFAYVAAFISSSYSTTIGRSGKPFNPLLGETYECDRQSDLGWRSIAEQVSHHPPVAAIYGEGKNWEFWMDQSMKTKFKGATLTVVPLGECHLNFKNGNRYSWHKPNTSIHNIIVGKLWVEQEGDVDIKCATSNGACKLTFISSGWTGENFSLKGVIKDGSGKAIFDVNGKYSTQIEYRPAGSKDPGTVVWKRTEPPKDNAKYYSFTLLACQLNEMENGIAPTDSRRRPDQRLMEEGNFDAANIMKKKLEDFQRSNKKETWTPSWFKRQADPDTKTEIWTYNGEYWPCKAKQDWSRCPSYIFSPP